MINVFPTHKEIADCAYFIYLSEGRPNGRQTQHWRQAEAQLIVDRLHRAMPSLLLEHSNGAEAGR